MSTTTARIYNFSSGPAVLPVPVLEQIQRDLVALPGVGMSIMEVSHRSKVFEDVIQQAEADIRALANIPSNYKVLFLQGGASLQFSMVPLNLLTPGTTADYIITGSWTEKAAKEAKKAGNVNIAASSEADNFSRIPAQDELKVTPGAAYAHITSNNTIEGTQWHWLPDVGGAPLVSDASSDLFCAPAFAIYTLGLVMRWLRDRGGLDAIGKVNDRKAAKLYAELDRTGYWRPTARTEDRSLMNVTFRLATEELEKKFVKESTAAGFLLRRSLRM